MHARRLIETSPKYAVCIFCASRLSSLGQSARVQSTRRVIYQRCHFSRLSALRQPPAEAVAERRDDGETVQTPSAPAKPTRPWGGLAGRTKESGDPAVPWGHEKERAAVQSAEKASNSDPPIRQAPVLDDTRPPRAKTASTAAGSTDAPSNTFTIRREGASDHSRGWKIRRPGSAQSVASRAPHSNTQPANKSRESGFTITKHAVVGDNAQASDALEAPNGARDVSSPNLQQTLQGRQERRQAFLRKVSPSRWESLQDERDASSRVGSDDARQHDQRQGWGQHLPRKTDQDGREDTTRKMSRTTERASSQDEYDAAPARWDRTRSRDESFVGFSDRQAAQRRTLEERTPLRTQTSPVEQEESNPARRRRSTRFELEDDADADPARSSSYSTAPRHRNRDHDRPARRHGRSARSEENMFDIDEGDEELARRMRREQRKREKSAREAASRVQTISLPPFISVGNLATALKVRPEDFLEKLEELGFEEATMDHVLNSENANLVAMEYNFEVVVDQTEEQDLKPRPQADDKSILPLRPPIVTIMGHVDHGKTTLLDFLRKSSVAASELGGITQHIGAFSVPMPSGRLVTFLDTPGHAAFLSMRQRGANVTDIVILVVAADDSVKPQTIEAIRHAKAARVPVIVAINKVDKDEADVQRVKQDLLRHEVEVEDFGGDVQAIEVSGKTGQGMPDLEEAIVTLSDVLDHRAEIDGAAEGWVIESQTTKAGRIATVLVRRGTLRPGDVVVAGRTWARVRSLRNEAGVAVNEAGPGTPVEVDGWRDQPTAGDEVLQAPDEAKATSVVELREELAERQQAHVDMDAINVSRRLDAERKAREKEAVETAEAAARAAESTRQERRIAINNALEEARGSERQTEEDDNTLYFVVKADVDGSAEAIAASIEGLPLSSQPVAVSLLRTGVGAISESDISHAAAVRPGHGIVISFNQDVPASMVGLAERNGVRIMDGSIIYKVIDDVRSALEALLPPLITTRVTGEADMLQVFEVKEKRQKTRVAGCRVRNGVMARNAKVRVWRGGVGESVGGVKVFEGTLASLKSQKRDVTEMKKGSECGVGFEGWDEFEKGDVVQCYEEQREARRLPA